MSLPDDATHEAPELTIEIDTTLAERIATLRNNAARISLFRQPGQKRQAWLLTILCWAIAGIGVWQLQTSPLLGVTLIATAFALALWRATRQRFELLAQHATARYRLSLREDGLHTHSENGETRLAWHCVERVEAREGATFVMMRNLLCLWIPDRCFADANARRAFIARIEQGAGLAHAHAQESQPGQAAHADAPGMLRGLMHNLLGGLSLLTLRQPAPRHIVASVPQLVVLVVLAMLIGLAGDLARVGMEGRFNNYALASMMYGLPWLLLAAWLAARLADRADTMLRTAVGVQAMWCWLALIVQGLMCLPPSAWQAAGSMAMLIWWLPFAYGMFASVPALVRLTGMPAEQRVGALLIVVYLLALPLLITPRGQSLWVEREDESETTTAEQRERWEAPTREAILYSQPRLIEEALARVKPGTPGKPELFLLALGGHGAQDVFMREVKSVTQLFSERFDTAGHSAALLNNPTTLNDYPLASVTALEETLRGMGQRMNRDEDVLMLFMTSHGGDDFRFDLSMWPYKFDDLTPQRLKAALDKAGIRHRVVIVSSCYSGGFVPPLADANTWAMTAARADRNSHGCSHEADWTFFGRAFFDEALRQTRSFEQAFEMAKKAIAEREKEEALTPSEPQSGGGEAVKLRLRAITQEARP